MAKLYDGPMIDAHHHLWDLAMDKHPWLSPKAGMVGGITNMEAFRKTYFPADYRAEMAGFDIRATVHVEALWEAADPLGETLWLEALPRDAGVAKVYVGAAPLAEPDGPRIIEAQAAHPRMRGLRSVLSHHPEPEKCFVQDPDLAARPAFRDSLALMQDLGLVLDVLAFPWQRDHLLRIAADFPRLQIVLNHCASPIDQDAAGLARWRSLLGGMGAFPNVALKLSNPGAFGDGELMDRVHRDVGAGLAAFGPERCLFGTDAPVSRRRRPVPDTVNLLRQALVDQPLSVQRAVFHDNAERIYRI